MRNDRRYPQVIAKEGLVREQINAWIIQVCMVFHSNFFQIEKTQHFTLPFTLRSKIEAAPNNEGLIKY